MSKPVLLSLGAGKVQELAGTANNDVLTWDSTLDGGSWKSAAGGGGGSGTVTSVGLTGGTSGIVIGGTTSPITTSGTYNLDAPLRFAFNTATPTEVAAAGQVSYNTDEGSLEQMFDGGHVKSVLGQTLHQRVLNETGSTLTKGQVVYVSGAQGNRVTVALAQANADSTSATIIGLVAYAIADEAEGYVITEGLIKGVNTNGFTEGLPVYLSPTTPGALTQTKPEAPQHLVLVGYCVRADATVGEILVKTQNGYELGELHDVYINDPTSGQILIYDATTGQTRWENASLTGGTGVTVTPGPGSLSVAIGQSVATSASPTFAGLTLTGFDGLIKADSLTGDLTGGASVDAATEIVGTLPVLNGGTGLTASGSSGNLLVSDGSAWASVAMSGDATIASTGALTLKNTGTAGTYGSASAVPVFITDAQGRVTSVTNTSIDISATAITSGTLGVARGGTGLSSIVSGRLLYSSSANTLAAGTLSNLDWSATFPTTNIAISPSFVPSGAGRTTSITGGFSTAGTGGSLTLNGGNSTSGTGGTALLRGGDGGTGTGGDLELRGGSGTVANGALFLGASTTGSITIGETSITTTIYGLVALENALSVANGGTGATTLTGYVKGNGTSAFTASATVPTSDLSGSIALGSQVSGTLPVANGGTGASSTSQNFVFAGPTSGSGAPSFRALVAGDLPATTTPYDLSGEFVGTPVASAVIMRFVAARAFTFGGTAYFVCVTGPTSQATFTVNVNGVSKGTVNIATSATSGTGTITSTSIAAGDLISVVATTPAAIVSPYWTLPGTV